MRLGQAVEIVITYLVGFETIFDDADSSGAVLLKCVPKVKYLVYERPALS